jgi:hypothetical protein
METIPCAQTRILFLTRGQFALIDELDYEKVKGYAWYPSWNEDGQCFYVMTKVEGKTTYLHRLIMQPQGKMTVDHINMNPLDNRRCNLRLATRSQNQMNHKVQSNNTSGFKGVHLFKRTGKFRAYIMVNGKEKHLGYFVTAEEAHAKYCEAAKEMHGEFARTR